MRKPISMAYAEAVAARYGIKPAPSDHPIYSEGSSIMFISARPRTKVIPPFLVGFWRRIYAANCSFWAGVMPPMPMFGRSWL